MKKWFMKWLGIASLLERLDSLAADVREIRNDITELSRELAIENAGIAALQTRMDVLESKVKEINITGIDPGAGSPLKSDNIVLVYGSGKKVQSEKQTASSTAVSPVVSAALDALSSSKRSHRGRPKKAFSATTE